MKIALALCLGLALASSGCSLVGGDHDRPGIYAAVGGFRGFENFDTAGTTLRAKDSDIGFLVRGGIRVAEPFAVEVSLEDASGYNLEQGSSSLDVDIASVVAQGKWFPVRGMLQPYLVAGVGWARADVETLDLDGTAVFYRGGLGVDLYLSSNLALFAEVTDNRLTGDIRELDHYDAALGIVFRF